MDQVQVILLAVVCICAVTHAVVNPGLKLRITQPGLNYAAQVAVDVLAGKVQGQSIPDQSGTAHVAVGKVEYELRSMRITGFGKPPSHVTVKAGQGITWSAAGASLSLHGDWKYKYRLGFIKISDHGSFDISVSGVSFSLSFTLGKDGNNRPTIKSTGCSSNIGHVSVKFHGGASWLYNLFDHQVAKAVEKQLSNVMCKAAESAVNKDAAAALAKMKVVTHLGHTLDLDYSLTRAPQFTATYMESFHKGELYWQAQHTEAPFTAPVFPTDKDTSSMLYVWMSDYTLNTLGYVAHQHGMAKYDLTAKDLPPDQRGVLNTTCTTIVCFGSFIPQLKKIPDASVELSMKTTKPPTLNVDPSGITGTFHGNISFGARVKTGELKHLFTSNVTVTFVLNVAVKMDKVTAHIASFKPEINVLESAIGKINDKALQFIITTACNSFVIKKLNELGEQGIDIPKVDHVHFTNPKIKLIKDAIRISTDLKYVPETLYFKPYGY